MTNRRFKIVHESSIRLFKLVRDGDNRQPKSYGDVIASFDDEAEAVKNQIDLFDDALRLVKAERRKAVAKLGRLRKKNA
jgi:hypothetical protein